MVPPSEEGQRPPHSAGVLYWALLTACTLLPWAAHYLAGWWAGPVVWYALVMAYDKLCVPKDSLCMGIPFMAPLVSIMALLALDLRSLVMFLRS